ncbi:Ger(x)C family spore germination C-terminal domain-containing protein [Lawsonibacter sp. LCP25S3_G6]|uniref:Ger(x)C family spore germination C-terminal domain-containing protein n=1 Tax=unclassified Lawsonibacter TaxID=2617946 RepID=UPI003F9E3CE0
MRTALALVLALCLLLSGCSGLPTAREMGDMALMRTMGVDQALDGVEMTVSTGPRAKGLQAEGEKALVLSAQADSLSAACLTIQGHSDSYVFYGYVDQLLVGEALAQEGIKPVLDYFARDEELGLGAQLWLVRNGTARQAVESGGEAGVDGRLSTLQLDGKLGEASISRTAGEIYSDLMEQGAAFVPALAVGELEDASLTESGYGVWKGTRLVGYLEGEAARGLELLVGRAPAEVLTLELEENRVSVRVSMVNTTVNLGVQGKTPTKLRITCRADLAVTEYDQELSRAQQDAISRQMEEKLMDRLEGALTALQQWEADCVGLGLRGAALHPRAWSEIQEQWPVWFGELEPDINLQVVVHE